VWIGFIWLRIGTVDGSYKLGNGPSGSITGAEFLDQLSDYQFLKKDSTPWSQSVRYSKVPVLSGGRPLHPQPQDSPCRGDREPYNGITCL
jgi:hypothetical protein